MANLNLTKLADASIILDGVKVAVKKVLKTKGEIIMADGQRLAMENIRAVGRGFVYDAPAKASTKKPATSKPAAASAKPSAKAPAVPASGNLHGRGAPVTADDLPVGKVITTKDGERLAVVTVLPNKGIVKLDGNVRVDMANIVRRGRGFVELDVEDVDVKSSKPAAKPSTKTETKPAAKPAAKVEHTAIVPSQLRGARVKVGGRYQTIEKIFGAKGQVKTVEGKRLEIANIKQKGTKYVYEVPEAASAKPAAKPAANKSEPKAATGGIRRRETPVDVSKPADSKKPAAGKSEVKPVKIKKVEALHADLCEQIRGEVSDVVIAYIAKHFDLQFVTSGSVYNNEVATFELTFALGSLAPKQIAALLAEMKADEGEEEEADDNDDDADDFDNTDLTADADDSDESEDDDSEDDDSEDDDSEDDDSEDDDSEDDDSEDDDSEDDDSEDDDSEEDDSEEDDDADDSDDDSEEDDEFENDESEEDDIEAQVAKGVAALEKKFGKHSSFEGYAENYLLSDAVEEAFGDDMEIGVTKLKTEKGIYVLVGLHEDGSVILINTKTSKLKKASITDVARMEEA